jgi:hypothetical protein
VRRAGSRVAVGLFWCLMLAGTAYYFLTRTFELRPERRITWAHTQEWWQGMTGHLLAQHREGLQVAELDPQTGRVVAVRDAMLDVDTVRQMVADLPRGHWLIVTALELSSPETTTTLSTLLGGAGWSGQLEPVNQGGGIVVLGRRQDSGDLFVVASQIAAEPPVQVVLPAGTTGPDGSKLGRSFAILVRPYD